jgi:hypothetical protein
MIVTAAGVTGPPARRLADLVFPIDLDEFFGTYFGQRPLVVRGWADKLSGLMSWGDLNRALRTTHLEWLSPETEGVSPRERVLATVRGQILNPGEFFTEVESLRRNRVRRIDPVRLTAIVRRRATLLVREVDFLVAAVGDLATRLERDFGDPIAATAIASFTSTPGLGRHLDEQDSLVLQLYGRKQWRIWEPTRRDPVHNDITPADPPAGDPVLDLVLAPGDVAYVPRGWFHAVAALDEPALHLTVHVYQRTGVDLLEWLLRRLHDEEIVRGDVARRLDPDARAECGRRLAAAIRSVIRDGGDLVDACLREWDAGAAPRRPTFSLPWSATSAPLPTHGVCVRLLAPRGFRDVDTSTAGAVRFVAGGRSWELSDTQFAALEPLLDGESVPLDQIRRRSAEAMSADEFNALVRDLLMAGLLGVAPSPDVARP